MLKEGSWVDEIRRRNEVAKPDWVVHKLACKEGFDHMIWCPACECGHGFDLERWGFNGDMVKPTLLPNPSPLNPGGHCSVKTEYYNYKRKKMMLCHFHIIAGTIIFCADCTHEMAGKTVALEPF